MTTPALPHLPGRRRRGDGEHTVERPPPRPARPGDVEQGDAGDDPWATLDVGRFADDDPERPDPIGWIPSDFDTEVTKPEPGPEAGLR